MGRSFGGTRRRARLLITRLVPSNASSGIATLCILIGVISRCLESCTLDLSMTRRSVECATLILEKKAWFLPHCSSLADLTLYTGIRLRVYTKKMVDRIWLCKNNELKLPVTRLPPRKHQALI